jgi:DNA primase
MYSQTLLDEIKGRITLSEVVGKSVILRKKGHEHHGLCPFHQEKTPSFTVSNVKGFYHCFGCGKHGSVFDFLMHQNHLTFVDSVKQAADMAGVTLPLIKASPVSIQEEKTRGSLLKILESSCQFFEKTLSDSQGESARNYLKKDRFLTDQTLKKFRLGLSLSGKNLLKQHLLEKGYPLDLIKTAGLLSEWGDGSLNDKFRNRIIFPILNRREEVIAFGGRLLGPGEPKYLNSPETPVFHKGKTLYNWSKARDSSQKKDPLVIVEGYMDVIALHQRGYERSVAPLGTALTEDQIQALWQLSQEPFLCFDGDNAGQRASVRAAERALPHLKPGKSLSFMKLPPREDPDTLTQKEGIDGFKRLLEHATPLATILWETESSQYIRKTPEERALLEKKLEDLCALIEESTVRTYYKREFKNRLFSWNTLAKKKPFQKNNSHSLKKIDSLKIQERILLSAFLLNSSLWETLNEDFTLIVFQISDHQILQNDILSYFSSEFPLEKETLTSYLMRSGHKKRLQEILAPDLFMHAPFLKLQEKDLFLEGWQRVRQAHSHRLCQKEEIELAKRRFRETLSSEDWQRYKRLKEVLTPNEDEKEI